MSWEVKPLGSLVESRNGLWKAKEGATVLAAVYRAANFTKDCRIKEESEPAMIQVEQRQLQTRQLINGDILIEKSGGGPNQPVGRAVLFNNEAEAFPSSFSNFTTRLRVSNQSLVSPNFLQKFLFSFYLRRGTESLQSNSTNIRNLQLKKYLDVLVPIPPLEEQERIVEVLDEAFSAIDKAKANIERNLINARELFQSRLNDIFSNPSEDWEVTSLGEACVFIDYRGRTPKKTDAGIRLITAKNVRMGYVKTDPQEFMSSDEYKDWMTRGIPKKGDVLFTTEAPLANVAMFDFTEKVALAQRIITLSPKLGLSGEFLSFHLQSRPSQLEILSQATGATVSGIKSRLLKLIKIAFPSLESQNFIVDHLEKLKQEVTRLEADYLSELDNLEELRQSILEQAFEGKLTEPVAA